MASSSASESSKVVINWCHSPSKIPNPVYENNMKFTFECTVCHQMPAPPVFSCTVGHITCHKCFEKIRKCVICYSRVIGQRSMGYELYYTNCLFLCRYANEGCTKLLKGREVKTHQEEQCDFRPIPCIHRYCENAQLGSYVAHSKFRSHFLMHKGQIIPTSRGIVINKISHEIDDCGACRWSHTAFHFKGFLFFAVAEMAKPQVGAWIWMLGNEQDAKRFFVKMFIGDTTKQQLSWAGPVYSIREPASSILKGGECFSMSVQTLKCILEDKGARNDNGPQRWSICISIKDSSESAQLPGEPKFSMTPVESKALKDQGNNIQQVLKVQRKLGTSSAGDTTPNENLQLNPKDVGNQPPLSKVVVMDSGFLEIENSQTTRIYEKHVPAPPASAPTKSGQPEPIVHEESQNRSYNWNGPTKQDIRLKVSSHTYNTQLTANGQEQEHLGQRNQDPAVAGKHQNQAAANSSQPTKIIHGFNCDCKARCESNSKNGNTFVKGNGLANKFNESVAPTAKGTEKNSINNEDCQRCGISFQEHIFTINENSPSQPSTSAGITKNHASRQPISSTPIPIAVSPLYLHPINEERALTPEEPQHVIEAMIRMKLQRASTNKHRRRPPCLHDLNEGFLHHSSEPGCNLESTINEES